MTLKKRSLSGIKPTGTPHLGNYLGMIKPAIKMQETHQTFYFIADYHALTSIREPESLKEHSYDLTATFASLGMDFEEHAFFRQSDIPEVTELTWFLACLTSKGLMERAHAFKDAQSKGQDVNMGLFSYPILMAADILIYDSHVVPVGKDQKQHLEITRDLALRFNHLYGETLVVPEAIIEDQVAVIPGLDGQKMSKSYDNTIEIFGAEKPLRKKVMRLVMDSRPPEEPKPDAENNIAIQLLKLFATQEVANETENKLREGGLGYGDLKKTLFEHYWEYFAEARAKRADLENNLDYVNQVLRESAEKARALASTVVDRAKKNCGLS